MCRVRTGAPLFYVAVMLGVVVLVNAGDQVILAESVPLLIWVAASLCLGWITRDPWFAFLPLLAVPIAAPFGDANHWSPSSGHDVVPIWFGVLMAVPVQAASVLIGSGGRHLYERVRLSQA